MTNFRRVIFPWLLVVSSFLHASLWLDKEDFYVFDLVWRVAIIAGVYFLGKIRLSFSRTQLLVVGCVFFFNLLTIRKFSPQFSVANALMASVIAPIAEEMFFRGWIISKLKGGAKNKIIVSSLLFGLYHLKNIFILTPLALVYQLLYAGLIVGPVFAWVRLKYDSLFLPIALHSVNNVIGLVFTEKFLPIIVRRSRKFS